MALAVSFAMASAHVDAQTFRVKLSRPDSFVGWDHGGSTQGWKIESGKFVGEAPAATLLSGWTFGAFDLRVSWAVAPDSAVVIHFPEVPKGEGLRLMLSADGLCGRLLAGEQELAPGRDLGIRPGRQNRLRVVRDNSKLAVSINDQLLYEVEYPAEKRLGLALSVDKGQGRFWAIDVEEPHGTSMFNGQDFTGWYTKGDIRRWRYENQEVVLAGRAGDYLRTEKLYGNFTWFLEYKMQKGGNSGLGLRTPHEGWPTADGMELQLLDSPYEAEIKDQPMMSVYGHVPPLARADRSEAWNRVVVKADGYMISAWVNGELVQHVNTFHHPELRHRPLAGWLGFQDHGAWIRVRNVSILEAPEGLGLEAWYQLRPVPPVAELLDRLINPERLAQPSSLQTQRVFAAVTHVSDLSAKSGEPEKEGTSAKDGPSEQKPAAVVLVEVQGPAALTGITYFGSKCKLQFFFDGESQPRIQAALHELPEKLPTIGKDRNPLLVCLPFVNRLRIEATEAEPCRFYFDFVRFRSGEELSSFTDVKTSFPRGWFESVNAILRWLGSGRYQEYSPYERVSSPVTSLGPGEEKALVTAEGPGVVRAFRLQAARRVLENNDLWLQIFYDDQRTPAIEAPVRFIFPALTRNFENYVMADQKGLTIFLPMPFSKRLEVRALNRGGRTLSDLVVTLTIAMPNDGSRTPAGGGMQLRGRFLPAQGGGELIRLKGEGRLVGVVCELPSEGDGGIFSLIVDGRPVDGWSADTLDALLGRSGDFRGLLSGRQGVLCWKFLHLNPIDFKESLLVTSGSDRVGARLVWYYAR
jgi:hypothetical protein